MLKVTCEGVYYKDGGLVPVKDDPAAGLPVPEKAREGTMAHAILKAHNTGDNMEELAIRFDATASHDVTYMGIIQTARASDIQAFPLPYVLTNCHNSLCAVGDTISKDDHVFGLSAARKYGGEFVPAYQSVVHSYVRERYAALGRMILGPDSYIYYDTHGTMAIRKGGPELARQLLSKTHNIPYPKVIAIYLTDTPTPGVGLQGVALELIRSTFKDGVVKNAVMEFFGPGVASLPMDYCFGASVIATETICPSSVWPADRTLKARLAVPGRGETFKPQAPADGAYYNGFTEVGLDKIRPMIALPFHPSNAYTIQEFQENLDELPHQMDEDTVYQLKLKNRPASLWEKTVNGKFRTDQGVIAGCLGDTYQNIIRAAQTLSGRAIGSGEFRLSIYLTSQPVSLELTRRDYIASLMAAGASIRSCFRGPCFGTGNMLANGAFPIRHSTRNFPNREGSKPSSGQVSCVAPMDAWSTAVITLNGSVSTGVDELPVPSVGPTEEPLAYDDTPYKTRIYSGVGRLDPDQKLVFGPNITDWPGQMALLENLLFTVCSAICDPVITTDELIPSGETSFHRSNPVKLPGFALSRKNPRYMPRAKRVLAAERLRHTNPGDPRMGETLLGHDPADAGLGSLVITLKPDDGPAREQAASYQRVLGGAANLAAEYVTKRYRSNMINQGVPPFTAEDMKDWNLQPGDRIYLSGIRAAMNSEAEEISAALLQNGAKRPVTLKLPDMTREERDTVLAGYLINCYTKWGRPVAARPWKSGETQGPMPPSARRFPEPFTCGCMIGKEGRLV